ncbi:uncharacterized protein METZ01_LOCUS422647, partial [marine metagenome]
MVIAYITSVDYYETVLTVKLIKQRVNQN